MGYRGSKSYFLIKFVKEQRVDGSCFGSGRYPKLRCTLTGGESCYPVRIPSKQLNYRSFSILNSMTKKKQNKTALAALS
jgi:hypothetical protein